MQVCLKVYYLCPSYTKWECQMIYNIQFFWSFGINQQILGGKIFIKVDEKLLKSSCEVETKSNMSVWVEKNTTIRVLSLAGE